MRNLFLALLITCAPISVAAQQDPMYGGNTVNKFGSTAIQNLKHGYTHYRNHNTYKHWIQPGTGNSVSPGVSCCNGSSEAGEGKGDCDIVRTYRDENNEHQYYIFYNGKRLDLPEKQRLRVIGDYSKYEPSPDSNSHACITEWDIGHPKVLCWILGDVLN